MHEKIQNSNYIPIVAFEPKKALCFWLFLLLCYLHCDINLKHKSLYRSTDSSDWKSCQLLDAWINSNYSPVNHSIPVKEWKALCFWLFLLLCCLQFDTNLNTIPICMDPAGRWSISCCIYCLSGRWMIHKVLRNFGMLHNQTLLFEANSGCKIWFWIWLCPPIIKAGLRYSFKLDK